MCSETTKKPSDPLAPWIKRNDDISDRAIAREVGCASTTISRARAGTTRFLRKETMAGIQRLTGVKPSAWHKYWDQLTQWEQGCEKKGKGR